MEILLKYNFKIIYYISKSNKLANTFYLKKLKGNYIKETYIKQL